MQLAQLPQLSEFVLGGHRRRSGGSRGCCRRGRSLCGCALLGQRLLHGGVDLRLLRGGFRLLRHRLLLCGLLL